jgi:hypothetical protein
MLIYAPQATGFGVMGLLPRSKDRQPAGLPARGQGRLVSINMTVKASGGTSD